MMRSIMMAMTVLGLLMAILTRSPGLLGLALVIMFVGLFGTVFSLAGDRISAGARSDVTMLPPEALQAIRDKSNAKAQDRAHELPSAPASGDTNRAGVDIGNAG